MPYKIDPKNKKCVVKADSGKRVGCTKGSVKKYLAALHTNVKDVNESEEFDWVEIPELPKDNDFISLVKYALEGSLYDLHLYTTGQLVNQDYHLVNLVELRKGNQTLFRKGLEYFTPENVKKEFDDVFTNIPEIYANMGKAYKLYFDAYELLKDLLPKNGLNESEESEIFKEISHEDLEVGTRVVVNGDADSRGFNNELGKVVYNWNEDEEDTSNSFTIAFDNWDKGHNGDTSALPFDILNEVCGVNKCWSFYDDCAYSEENYCENISDLKFYTINTYDLFDQLNESEDEFDWVEDIEGINIGDFYEINLEYPIVAKVEDIFFDDSKVINSDNSGYVVKVRYFNDNEEEKWSDYLEEINLDWMYNLTQPNEDGPSHWVKVTKEYAEKLFNNYEQFKSPMVPESKNINESEEWYDDVLKENPLLRFDDLKVGDIISLLKTNMFSNLNSEFNNLIQDDIYYHIDSFKEATTHRNGYAEKETVAVCSLMKENPDTGNYYGISRETIDLVRGNNKPIWTLIYREGVMESINESEWFEDVVNEPIMLNVEELEMGDIVIPTPCFKGFVKDGEYIVIGKGTSVKLLEAPTHWVTLKRNTNTDIGGVFIEHDTETGKNCRFKLLQRENIIEESEEFDWVEDVLSTSPLEFIGKEMMIDVSDLNDEEKIRLLYILEPHIDRDLDGSSGDSDWGWDCLIKNKRVKSVSLHCGIEDNEYEPQKGRVCCLSYKFGEKDEFNPESIVPIRGKDLLGLDINQQTNINESEEEEFNWIEDIIDSSKEGLDITKYIDVWRNKLVEGSIVKITGRWEDMDFSSDLATIVEVPDNAGSHLLKFDRVITEFETNQEGNHTHCGENEIQNIKCECQRKKHGDEVGKCWWTNLEFMEEVLYYPFESKQITESEEDDFTWAEDLLDFNNPINITDQLDIMEELPVGSILQVQGYQDDMEFDMEEVKLIDKAEDKNFESTYYLFKLKYERGTGNEMTHCGNGHMKICECRDENENDEISQSEIGKCWWIELKKQDKVIYYPNRIDLSENKTKKPLLTEGRYDAITRKTVRDIMKVFTDGDANSYNLPLDITGEYEYEQEGLAFSVELDIVRDESIDTFKVTTAIADDEENVIMLTIILGHDFNKTELEKLFYKLQEDIIHEIEHFTQIGTNRIEDRPIYKGNTANLKTTYGHHKNVLEIPALVRGFYRRAKLEKRPLDEIMIEDLDYEIERGNLTKYAAKKLLTLWVDYAKKHLPKAIYSN